MRVCYFCLDLRAGAENLARPVETRINVVVRFHPEVSPCIENIHPSLTTKLHQSLGRLVHDVTHILAFVPVEDDTKIIVS